MLSDGIATQPWRMTREQALALLAPGEGERVNA